MRSFHALMLVVFALTLFTSATLLFMIQPLVGKMMLPLLGGTPEVWNTCMVFFQAVLLAGYAYAHATTRWFGVRRQAVIHLTVLLLPLLLFFFVSPLEINKRMIGGGEVSPVLNVLLVLLLSVGLPFFVVSTSAPLLQKWFSSTNHPSAHDPYFLYGASNFGSMLSLLGYPLFIEPYLRVWHQRVSWAWGYGMLVLCIGGCVGLLWVCPPARREEEGDNSDPPAPENGTGANATAEKATAVTATPPAPPAPPPAPAPAAPESTASGRRNRKNRKQAERVSTIRPEDVVAPVMALEAPETLPSATRRAPASPARKGDLDVIPLARKLRWVLLGAVPVSLLMGVTTYMTTDIAAIPLLWIPPLALYLFTFIVVFASQAFQKVLMALYLCAHVVIAPYLLTGTIGYLPDMTFTGWFFTLACLGGCWGILYLPDDGDYIRRGMILALPLMILLIVFMMLSEIRPAVHWNIILQLETLFVATMVCHGELARDRPSPKHLTEFFMLMSVGGVVGGIFNALFAPLAFNSLAEYPVALVVACLLLPPLLSVTRSQLAGAGQPTDEVPPAPAPTPSSLSRLLAGGLVIDLAMAGVFLVVGGLLIGLRVGDNNLDYQLLQKNLGFWMVAVVVAGVVYGYVRVLQRNWDGPLKDYPRVLAKAGPALIRLTLLGILAVFLIIGSIRFGVNLSRDLDPQSPIANPVLWTLNAIWAWAEVLLLLALAGGGIYLVLLGRRTPDAADTESEQRRDLATRALDGLLPLSLAVLTVGLIWGASSEVVYSRMKSLAQAQELLNILQMRAILSFGVPAVLCYIFVERSRRFGLGVGAILLGAGFCTLVDSDILLQRRSFFGVLKVEYRGPNYRRKDGSAFATYVTLVHGTTLHGKQFNREFLEEVERIERESKVPQTRDAPLTYYHRTGPLGQVFQTYSPDGMSEAQLPPVGVIGLGTGTTASYGQKGQHMTYYDIDRLVKQITWDTDKYFSYITKARARGVLGIGLDELKLNDARLAIEREVENLPEEDRFGILVVDAFSSDAIPIHLITKEAVLLFKKRVRKDGLICYHISNRYLDLKPVLANLANDPDIALHGLYQNDSDERYPGKAASTWVVLCADKDQLARLNYQEGTLDLFRERVRDLDERIGREKDPKIRETLAEEKRAVEKERAKQKLSFDHLKDLEERISRETNPKKKDMLLDEKILKLPRTLSDAFTSPRVDDSITPLVVLPGLSLDPSPVPAIGQVLALRMTSPIWYDLDRALDPTVGVWTDDYASIPSVFLPWKRRRGGE